MAMNASLAMPAVMAASTAIFHIAGQVGAFAVATSPITTNQVFGRFAAQIVNMFAGITNVEAMMPVVMMMEMSVAIFAAFLVVALGFVGIELVSHAQHAHAAGAKQTS
jgi:hypothetical protein